jgi:hypothetical protein
MAETEHEKKQQVTGLAIASTVSCIKRIKKLRYKVKSQSDAWERYEVVKQDGHNIGGYREAEWIGCKHVYTVSFSKELRRR